jgi:hypothetical protein
LQRIDVSIRAAEDDSALDYRNPNALHFLVETVRRGIPFTFALVMMMLYTSTKSGMADVITNELENLTGHKPISFRQYVIDYGDSWT